MLGMFVAINHTYGIDVCVCVCVCVYCMSPTDDTQLSPLTREPMPLESDREGGGERERGRKRAFH